MLLRLFNLFKTPLFYATLISVISIVDWFYRDIIDGYSLLLATLFNFVLLCLLLVLNPRIVKFIGTLGIFITAVLFYVFDILKYQVDPQMIWVLLTQTSKNEVMMFTNFRVILFLMLLCLFCIIFWIKTPYNPIKISYFQKIIIILILIIPTYYLYRSIRYVVNTGISEKPIPYSLTIRSKRLWKGINERYSADEKNYENDLTHTPQSINIYLIIGETVRADHLTFNGYKRQTTPLLDKEQIINFGITKSCGNLTYISWRYLFSNARCSEDFSSFQKPIPFYFSKNGFKTFMAGQNDEESILAVVKEVTHTKNIDHFDQNMHTAFKSMHTINPYQLFILNSFGSHMPYVQPSLSLENLFSPICDNFEKSYSIVQSCPQNNLINHYDNTLLFLDYQISSIINDLKKSDYPTLLLYTSDHGEQLNEQNKGYGHGGKTLENYMVPLLVWVNDVFKKSYPLEYKNLLTNEKKAKNQLTHEVIWHSIMDIGGFNNKDNKNMIIDNTRSIFKKELKPQIKKDWFKVEYTRN